MTAQLVKVPFHNHEILVVEQGEDRWLPLRPLCERFGLSMQGQHLKLQKAEWACVNEMLMQMPGDDQARTMTVLHLRSLAGWLFSISPNKVKLEVREALVAYQKEAAEVLYNHFAPKASVPALPSGELATLRAEMAELKALVVGLASKPAPYPNGTIGPQEARTNVLGPLRTLARQLANVRGTKYRSALLKLDQRLRRLVSYPNDNGQSWDRFPADRYGELTGAVGLLQADAQSEIKAHADRVAREAQLPIAG